MNKSLFLNGKRYISAGLAAEITHYANDYIGQLCRSGKITSTLVGRNWYVSESEVLDYKNKNSLTHNKILKSRRLKNAGLAEKMGGNANVPEIEQKIKFYRPGVRNKITTGVLYYGDNRSLFPVLKKEFDALRTRNTVLKHIEKQIGKIRAKSNFEKFINRTMAATLILLTATTFVFGKKNMEARTFSNFVRGVGGEISFLDDSYAGSLKAGYAEFKKNISVLNQNGNQLASSAFFSEKWNFIVGWFMDITKRILKPWVENEPATVVPADPFPYVGDSMYRPPLLPKESSQALTLNFYGMGMEYVDFKIAELKDWFKLNPLAPNVNRYYVTNQNDKIVDSLSGSINNVNNSLSDFRNSVGLSVSTQSLAVTGSTTVAGISASDWLSVGTTTNKDVLTLDGAFYLSPVSSVPPDSSSRLYNSGGDLYWAGNLVGSAAVGNWVTDGTDVWRSSGKVGIGTASPSSLLFVQNAVATSTIPLLTVATSTGDSLFTVLSSGSVGLGVDNPTANLEIRHTNGVILRLINSRTAGISKKSTIEFNDEVEPLWSMGNDYEDAGVQNFFIRDNIAGAYRLLVNSSGNVGIGTTSPSSKLDVWGNLNVATSSTPALFVNTATGYVGLGTPNPSQRLNVVGNMTVAGNGLFTGSDLSVTLDASADVDLVVDKGATSRRGDVVLRVGGQDRWYVGMPDSDSWGDGTEFYIGSSATAPKLTINRTSGNVGIGTSTPARHLNITNSDGLSQILLEDTLAAANFHYGGIKFANGDFSLNTMNDALTATSKLFIASTTGNVGIGTDVPIAKLHLVGNSGTGLRITDGSKSFAFGVGSNNFTITEAGVSTPLTIQAGAGSNLLFLKSGGYVGIGTTTPSYKLDVVGTFRVDAGAGQTAGLLITPVTTSNVTVHTTAADHLDLGTVNTTRLRISNQGGLAFGSTYSALIPNDNVAIFEGNVGIGTDDPAYKLDVVISSIQDGIRVRSAGANQPSFRLEDITNLATGGFRLAGGASELFQFGGGFSDSPIAGMEFGIDVMGDSANAKITMDAASVQISNGLFETRGAVFMPALANDSTGYFVCLNTTTGQLATSTSQCGGSSERFKENINPLTYGIAEIQELQPVYFDWREEFMPGNEDRQVGFIAEEVAEVIPEIVGRDQEGNPTNVDYGKLTPIIVKAIQEQQKQIEQLLSSVTPSMELILAYLKDLGVEIGSGFTKIAKLFVGEVHIEGNVCVDDTCITKEQFKEMILRSGVGAVQIIADSDVKPEPEGQSGDDEIPPAVDDGNGEENMQNTKMPATPPEQETDAAETASPPAEEGEEKEEEEGTTNDQQAAEPEPLSVPVE